MKYILLDTETTGTAESDRIIQLGYMVLDGKNIEVYNEYCSSDVEINFAAMEVHGITPEMIEGKESCTQMESYNYLQTLNSPENVMIIHNAPFDIAMLEKEGFVLEMQLIDTLRCAKHLYEDEDAHRLQYFRYKLGLYKLEGAEAERLGIEIKAHDAIGDVLVLKLFLSELRKKVQERFPDVNPVEKLIELTKKPVFVKTLRFGKHKGKLLEEVAAEDPGYLNWMKKSMDLDEDMKYSLDKVMGN